MDKIKPKPGSQNESKKLRRDRYWSVMLVGEHGRIIPLRWFKTAVIGAACMLVLAVAAAAVFGILFKKQTLEIEQLRFELQESRDVAAKLRDEKDLYLTQLVASQKSEPPVSKNGPDIKQEPADTPENADAKDTPAPAIILQKEPASKPEPAAKPEPAVPQVQWRADIRNFKTDYDPDQEVLKAEFRIYNTSRPKKPLSGRTVLVFKQMDAPSLQWFSVPRVQISDGKPESKRGRAFKINNYRTMSFRAYQQKAPLKYDTATVFIFSDAGNLITERDFSFQIDTKPPTKNAEKESGAANRDLPGASETKGNQKDAIQTTAPAAQKIAPAASDGGDSAESHEAPMSPSE